MRKAADTLMKTVDRFWPFNQVHYPKLKGCSDVAVRNFGRVHMTLHVAKEAGTLAKIQERHEHRGAKNLTQRDWDRVKKLAMKIIVSGFRLFVLAGGTPRELEKYITKS